MNPTVEFFFKRIFGGEIPEVPEVYYESRKFYRPEQANPELIPYVYMALYTEDEMKMITYLPGSVEKVAEGTGMDKDYIEKTLNALAAKGKVMYAPNGFARLPSNIVIAMDQLYFAHDGTGEPYDQKLLDTLLVMCMSGGDRNYGGVDHRAPMRIIPKWNSIKNVPGVMPCENIKEILLDSQAAGELATERCTCQVLGSMWAEGKYPATGFDKPEYLHEGTCNKYGHCLQLGRVGKYYQQYINAYAPNREETLQKLEETEAAACIYVATNSKDITHICCCNFDYCSPNRVGAWNHIPSRFRPAKNDDKCVSCGDCYRACQFKAIDPDTLQINPDLCKGCGNCVVKCQAKALKMEIVHPVEWIADFGNALWED